MTQIRSLTESQTSSVLARPSRSKPGPASALADSILALKVGAGVEIKFVDLDRRRKGIRAIRALAKRNVLVLRIVYIDDLTVQVAREE